MKSKWWLARGAAADAIACLLYSIAERRSHCRQAAITIWILWMKANIELAGVMNENELIHFIHSLVANQWFAEWNKLIIITVNPTL